MSELRRGGAGTRPRWNRSGAVQAVQEEEA